MISMMTDGRYRMIAKKLKRDIRQRRGSLAISPSDPVAAIRDAISNSRVPKLGAEGPPGTAMFPVASRYWHIGCFGSVWLDVAVQGTLYRVSYYPDNSLFTVHRL